MCQQEFIEVYRPAVVVVDEGKNLVHQGLSVRLLLVELHVGSLKFNFRDFLVLVLVDLAEQQHQRLLLPAAVLVYNEEEQAGLELVYLLRRLQHLERLQRARLRGLLSFLHPSVLQALQGRRAGVKFKIQHFFQQLDSFLLKALKLHEVELNAPAKNVPLHLVLVLAWLLVRVSAGDEVVEEDSRRPDVILRPRWLLVELLRRLEVDHFRVPRLLAKRLEVHELDLIVCGVVS